MTEPAKAQTIDTEIVRHCAFSLPAVTLTLGRKNWPCLRDTYELLIADMQVGEKKLLFHPNSVNYTECTMISKKLQSNPVTHPPSPVMNSLIISEIE